jgi:signal transduction histidine kinase
MASCRAGTVPLHATGRRQRLSSDSPIEATRRLAHDLRNVLVSLQSVAAAIERVLDPRDAALAGQLALVVERATSLSLELASVEGADPAVPHAGRCRMAATLLRSRPLLERVASPVPVELRVQERHGVVALSDEALERVAINLVRNARRASGHIGAIRIGVVRSTDPTEGVWDTLVVDNATESHDDGAWSRLVDGEIRPGLGLTIVRELVESAGGRVELLRSSEAVFRVACALPVRPEPSRMSDPAIGTTSVT